MTTSRIPRAALLALALGAFGCRIQARDEAQPLPSIPVYEIRPTDEGVVAVEQAPERDPLGELASPRRVSITANNADARTLLLWLAQQAGVSLLVAPDVTARVSVAFTNVPAVDAMRAVIAQAGLSVLASAPQSPWPPVVFRQLPVNINQASVETIVARFGVTVEMAKWIVENRERR